MDTFADPLKVTVKWLQIALIFLALIVLGLFAVQAFLRRKTRPTRMAVAEKQPMPAQSNDHFLSNERF